MSEYEGPDKMFIELVSESSKVLVEESTLVSVDVEAAGYRVGPCLGLLEGTLHTG